MLLVALRRLFWAALILLFLGAVLYYALQQMQHISEAGWSRGYQALMHAHVLLRQHSNWLHVSVHGLSYVYLLWRWPSIVAWVNRRRIARGHPPMSVPEQRRMAVHVMLVIVLFEALLLLRHLG